MRARWYDAANGRFLARDPAGPNLVSPASLNAFIYGDGRPLVMDDPTGFAATTGDDEAGCSQARPCRNDVIGQLRQLVAATEGSALQVLDVLSAALAPPSAPNFVLDIMAGDDPSARALAEAAWQSAASIAVTRLPSDLPGFPGATRLAGVRPLGKGLVAKRWTWENRILEEDTRHGTIEMYTKKGAHLGEFNYETGEQLNGPVPGRRLWK